MPDGYDRRPATGDRPPARKTTARQRDEAADFDADPYDDPYEDNDPDGYDDGAGDDYPADYDYPDTYGDTGPEENPQRRGPVRRFRSWLGFPTSGQGDDDADFYRGTDTGQGDEPGDRRSREPGDDRYDTDDDADDAARRAAPSATLGIPAQPTDPPPPPPGVLKATPARRPERRDGGEVPGDDGTDDEPGHVLGSALGERPATDRPRRARATSPWEDIMLGSGPPPGTPMTDAMPADTLPPDTLAVRPPAADSPATPLPTRPTTQPGRRAQPNRGAAALSDWLDPMDPVDPLDPRDPTGTGETTESATTIAPIPSPATEPAPTRKSPRTPAPAPSPIPDTAVSAHNPADGGDTEDTDSSAGAGTGSFGNFGDFRDFTDEGPEPRRMLRLLPTPVLADGGGMVVDGGRVGRLTVRASAVRGGLHAQQGTPRQNSFAVGPDPSGKWTISIICDGVDGGYAPELAAQVAIRSTYRAVARMVTAGRHEDWDWTTTMAAVQTELRTRLTEISARARTLGRPAPATRLAVLVTSAEPLQDDRVDMAVLGDSTILRLAEGGWRAPLGIRETSADSPPPALPEQGTEHVRVCRTTWRPSDALVVMTGGFADSLGAGSGGLAARLADDWRRPPELTGFLDDVAQGCHTDDGAVIALWPEP